MESNTWCENLLLWFISKDSYQYPCLEYCTELFKKDEVKLKVLDYYLSYCWYHTLGWKNDWKYSSLVIKKNKLLNLFHVTGQHEEAAVFYRMSSIQIPWASFKDSIDSTGLFWSVLLLSSRTEKQTGGRQRIASNYVDRRCEWERVV